MLCGNSASRGKNVLGNEDVVGRGLPAKGPKGVSLDAEAELSDGTVKFESVAYVVGGGMPAKRSKIVYLTHEFENASVPLRLLAEREVLSG